MTNAFRFTRAGIAVITLSTVILHAAETQQDWPQWRGPDRCGICPDKIALAESWPTAGLQRLWVSGEIPSGESGGYGSPVVADGYVFLYANEKYAVPSLTRTLPENILRDMSWVPTNNLPPEAVLKAVDEARLSDERGKLVSKQQINSFIDKWVKEHLTETDRKTFSNYCNCRLQLGKDALPVADLERLTPLKDKLFATEADLEKALDDAAVTGLVRQTVIKRAIGTQDVGKDVIYCLNAVDGKTVWRKEYDKIPGKKSALNASSSTPCIAAGKVLVAGADGALYCLSAKDGSEQWAVKFGKGNQNSSPLVLGDLVIVSGSPTCAIRISDGKVVWQQTKGGGANSPVVWNAGDKKYLLCNSNRVRCLDPLTGEVLWDTPGGHASSAAVAGDIMAVQAGSREPEPGLMAYRISPAHAEKLWSVKVFDPGASPIIYNGCVYSVGEGHAVCVSVADGRIAWDQKIGNTQYSSPVLADSKLYALVDDHGSKLIMLRASPEKFELLAKANLAFLVCTSPAIANGRLYVRQEKSVACYDLTVSSLPPPAAGASTAK